MKRWQGMLLAAVCALLLLSACGGTDGAEPDGVPPEPPPAGMDTPSDGTGTTAPPSDGTAPTDAAAERAVPDPADWPEITADGVDEALLWAGVDPDILETAASELQALVEEEAEAERANPEIVLTEGWRRVFDSERYARVLSLGPAARKPLYWIIYKSPSQGLYEYLCAAALYELSGYDFSDGAGVLTWRTSKELLDRWNERILSDRAAGGM